VSTRASLEEYDLVILGGGTGGTVAAWTFATEGQRVAYREHGRWLAYYLMAPAVDCGSLGRTTETG